jgi:hypothetical protein
VVDRNMHDSDQQRLPTDRVSAALAEEAPS